MNKRDEEHVVIETAEVASFFRREREVTRLADADAPIPGTRIISFGDPSELLAAITPSRIALVRAVRERPESITGLARRMKRDRAAVARDIKLLNDYGLVDLADEANPGHGRHKIVKPAATGSLRLEATI